MNRTSLTSHDRYSTRRFVLLALLAALALTRTSIAELMKMDGSVRLDSTGNAAINLELKLPLQPYTMMKQQYGNPISLMRTIQDTVSWGEVRDMKGGFRDPKHSVELSCTRLGASQPVKEGHWQYDLSGMDVSFITSKENVAFFNSAASSAIGAMNIVLTIETPREAPI